MENPKNQSSQFYNHPANIRSKSKNLETKEKFTIIIDMASAGMKESLNITPSCFSELKTETPSLGLDNWEVIAGHLDLLELINLSDMGTDAREAARLVFKRKYPTQKFKLEMHGNRMEIIADIWLLKVAYACTADRIFSGQGVISLKFVRNFGDLISKLKIDIKKHAEYDYGTSLTDNQLRKSIAFINKFSAESCKILKINDYSILIETPFQNIDKVDLHTKDYSMTEFNTLIENVRSLYVGDDRYLKQKMPQIKKLHVINSTDGNILETMQLNSQIKQLKIHESFGGRRLKWKMNGSEMHVEGRGYFNFLNERIRPENFDKCEKLCYQCVQMNQGCSECVNFVSKFKNLKCLSIEIKRKKVFELIKNMPTLQELQVCMGKNDANEIDYYELEDYNRKLLSFAASQSNLLILTFHYEEMDVRERCQKIINEKLNGEQWFIVGLHDNGPKLCKYSLVFNRVPSA